MKNKIRENKTQRVRWETNKNVTEKNWNKQLMWSEDRPGVITDWKTMVGMICGKGVFESGVKERRGDRWWRLLVAIFCATIAKLWGL